MAINFPASPSTNDTHTENAITWIFNGTSWDAQGDQVTAASIGLGSVDNTADADKPVSTAQQAALDLKQDVADAHGSVNLEVFNAVQGWWAHPVVASFSDDYADASYVGFASRMGDWGVVRIDNATGKHNRTVFGNDTIDDHNVPSIAQLPDGRIIVAYSKHATEAKVYTRTSRSSNLDDWGDEVEITTSANATYASIRVVDDYLQLWYRTGVSSAGQWIVRYMTITINNPLLASQWGSERTAYNSEYLGFVEHGSAAGTWRVMNTQHPVSGSDHNIYYTFIQKGGTVRKPGGTTLGNIITDTGLPVTDAEGLEAVSNGGGGTDTTRLLAVGENSDDLPACLYARFTTDGGGSDGVYYMGNYDTSSTPFDELSLGPAGIPIDSPVTSFYFGGACFNTDDKTKVYVCREASGTWTLEELTITSDLLSYSSSTLASSSNKLARPYYDNGRVFYSEFTSYISYSSWIGNLKWVAV